MTNPEPFEVNSPWRNLRELAVQVRRRPMIVRDLRLLQLVRYLSERWRVVSDLQTVSEEAPVTAWIIRRKSELVLPQPEPETDDAEEQVQDEPGDELTEWASDILRQLYDSAQGFYFRPRIQEPLRPYRPIKGATTQKLMRSWPGLRARKPSVVPRVVQVDTDPLEAVMDRLVCQLEMEHQPLEFDALLKGRQQPSEVTTTFLGMVHLWHRQMLEIEQRQAYDPIWIALRG